LSYPLTLHFFEHNNSKVDPTDLDFYNDIANDLRTEAAKLGKIESLHVFEVPFCCGSINALFELTSFFVYVLRRDRRLVRQLLNLKSGLAPIVQFD
jgi:hypothetical protein